jgi:hypothetical protein
MALVVAISGPITPLPMALEMDFPPSKSFRHSHYYCH